VTVKERSSDDNYDPLDESFRLIATIFLGTEIPGHHSICEEQPQELEAEAG
jgi:hypothetical protein